MTALVQMCKTRMNPLSTSVALRYRQTRQCCSSSPRYSQTRNRMDTGSTRTHYIGCSDHRMQGRLLYRFLCDVPVMVLCI